VTTRLVLVRHGRPTTNWSDGPGDAGLDEIGHEQARAMARSLDGFGSADLVTSPLRRTRETAAALEAHRGVVARIEPGVAEIASPADLDVSARARWLGEIMAGRWADDAVGDDVRAWRDDVVATLVAMASHTIVVTHYVAINVAVSAATGDERVAPVRPAHCSAHHFEVVDGRLHLVALGAQGESTVGTG
jgi:broad specificity phosphatase PhoE